MTVLEDVEIDIDKLANEMKYAIINNDPIEDALHVIAVMSNPCNFKRRVVLAKEFIARMEFEENVILYVVELAYGNEPYYITQPGNPRHLQLRGDTLLWHKENMINIGVKKLLPPNWKTVAWIDADVEFENPYWAADTLRILNGSRDIVQLYSHCVDMARDMTAMRVFQSFGFQYSKGLKYTMSGVNFFHPGFAWACTRRAFEKLGGMYEHAILGSGDYIMTMALINKAIECVNRGETEEYLQHVLEYEQQMKRLRLGYIPGVIRHHYHGSKNNRGYDHRWKILIKYAYNPRIHVTHDKQGLLVPTKACPEDMLKEIRDYFFSRQEDS
jgi:hypothetical protein